MAKAIELTDSNFEELVLKSEKPVLVDFWAQWCGPCRAVAPVVEQIAEEKDGEVVVGKVDVDTQRELAQTYRITSIPALLVFKGGKVVDQQIGAVPKSVLTGKLDKAAAMEN